MVFCRLRRADGPADGTFSWVVRVVGVRRPRGACQFASRVGPRDSAPIRRAESGLLRDRGPRCEGGGGIAIADCVRFRQSL